MEKQISFKSMVKKAFLPVFIIVFIIVALFIGWGMYDSVYERQTSKALAEHDMNTSGMTSEELRQVEASKKLDIELTDAVFTCENDNSVQSRGYVYMHGLGDHNLGAFDYQRGLIGNDPKTKSILDFDYNENLNIAKISEDFVSQFDKFISKHDFEEIVIIGQSAGGTIAAYSANKLKFVGAIELHTIASPLRGCDNKGFKEKFVTGEGMYREIGIGFNQFGTPPSNMKVYHHKTISDEVLIQCDTPVEMQYNNLERSSEFYYEEYNHETIMHAVSKLIIDCHK